MALGFLIRLVEWRDDQPEAPAPGVLWTMGFLALGFLAAAAQLWLPVAIRRQEEKRGEIEFGVDDFRVD
jgi:hypothetical protein